MKQLLQNMRDGATRIEEIPVPQARPGMALVRNAASLVSAGTERMVVEFAEKSLVGKARSRPDLVRQVLRKARQEGILPTIKAAFNRLDQPMALGYSSAGTIVEAGTGLQGFKTGDRVACAGGGFASHAEYVVAPQNLLVHLPGNVDEESAAFTTLGAIALQGLRLAEPQIGENVAVIGLGLLGLLSVQMAKAAGCRVFGVDIDPARVALAKQFGVGAAVRSAALEAGMGFSPTGFDRVLICADTKSNDPVELAGELARDRARVVAVGAVGMSIPRRPYYDKELQFIVSRSYGPGRYDPAYEEGGQDYPIGYVRWTEGRNLEAFVHMLANGSVNVKPLITHRIPIEQGAQAYELITGKRHESFLGVLLTYPGEAPLQRMVSIRTPQAQPLTTEKSPVAGVLGAGNYANAVFLPVVKQAGVARLKTISSAAGLHAQSSAHKFGFENAASGEEAIFNDDEINTVVLLTRHNEHARQVITALEHGKHVYCEKPPALNIEELQDIADALQGEKPLFTVGYNRRFAPLAQQLKEFFTGRTDPLWMHYRVNAGAIPPTHWLHDPKIGGGRIIGEACHFIDFLVFLTGKLPEAVIAQGLPEEPPYHEDNLTMTFEFEDGSLGTVSYLANGDRALPKERIEVFCGGKSAVLDDFRLLECYRGGNRQKFTARGGQNKGHLQAWKAFLQSINHGNPPIQYDEVFSVSQATFAALDALRSHERVLIQRNSGQRGQ